MQAQAEEQRQSLHGRQYAKNPATLEATLKAIKFLRERRGKATFNEIRSELRLMRVLANDRSLRQYLDLLLGSGLLKVRREKTEQPNIRERQLYSLTSRKRPIVEAGEKCLLFHGLNWEISSPRSIKLQTDLVGLSRSKFTPKTIFSSLEDSIVEELRIARSRTNRPEAIVFATALIATEKKLDLEYLIWRARGRLVVDMALGVLLLVEETFTSPTPDIHDVKALFELRAKYQELRRPSIKSLVRKMLGEKYSLERARKLAGVLLTENDVLEYAGKQLGLSC